MEGFFDGVEGNLEELDLSNITIQKYPVLHMNNLIELNISNNIIKTFDSAIFNGLPRLKKLDLSRNKITRIRKSAWIGATLEWLDISKNQITKVFNDTFEGLKDLRELKMHEIPLMFFDSGSLGKAPKLETLSVSTYDKIRGLNFAGLLHNNYVMKSLEIAAHHPNFYHYLDGKLQKRLSHIKITGKGVTAISVKALSGVQSQNLHLTISDTGIQKLSEKFFRNLGETRILDLDVRRNILTKMARPYTSLFPGQVSHIFTSIYFYLLFLL